MRGPGVSGDIVSKISIKDVEYVPSASDNLISVKKPMDDSYDVWFDHKDMKAHIGHLQQGPKSTSLITGDLKNGLFNIPVNTTSENVCLIAKGFSTLNPIAIWHA